MQPYTKVYLKHFKLTTADFIPCEVCGAEAVDTHHIKARSIARKLYLCITNLMALCRTCHEKYGDKKQHREFLQQKHDAKLQACAGVPG